MRMHDMLLRRKMEVTLKPLTYSLLVLILLMPHSPYAMSIGSPNFLNITTLSTYSFTSPEGNGGAASPQDASAAGDATGVDQPTVRTNDSSAQASDHEGRSFPVAHKGRHPANILGKPSGEGHWATPSPHSAIVLPFVPLKLYSQVRHTYEVNHKPRSDAIASASSPEELAAAARLRESIQTKKISEVYSEEGYEDTAYDHAGFKKDAGFSEGHEGHEGGKKKVGNGGGGGGGYGGLSEAASTSEDQKYPFHKIVPSDAVPRLSPLRYALNPASGAIPTKTAGGTEFYDSTQDVECPTVVELPSIPGRAFRRPPEEQEDGEKSEKEDEDADGEESREPKLAPTPPPPPSPRLKGLGDKIDCLRTKFFGGEEPLDNPFFKEQVVNVAKNEIGKAKAEQSRIQESIKEDNAKGEETKRSEKVESKGQERLQPQERERSLRGYAAGFESYNPTAAANKVDKQNTSAKTVLEPVSEDRMGEEIEDSATGGVGAAVEGLPSAAASDSDMQGFYADIMGHIQSATGNIVRQAYSGRNGANSDSGTRRIRPPKAPRPPIIGFLDEREPFPASHYPSVLPAPDNYEESDNRYAVAEDVEEGEEYAGSEKDEEQEEVDDEREHHHHSHPSFLGGAHKIILRPINPQPQRYTSGGTGGSIGTEAPFRPSPLLYVQTHPAPQRVVLPAHTHSSHQSSVDSHMHHHHHHPYSGDSHSHHHHSPSGIRTFLVPAGKRPVPLSPPPPGHHYHINTINGLRGSGTLLIPTSTRHTSTTPNYPSITLYPSRSPFTSLKRQSPVGQEFDGLLTATTQSVATLAAPPSNFGKYYSQQPLRDMVASSSSVSKAFLPPRNIEYFTLKDSIHNNKNPAMSSKLLPPESETLIPQITFTTTEKYPNLEQHYPSQSNVAPLPPVMTNSDGLEVSKTYDSSNVDSATKEYQHGESEMTEGALTRKENPLAKIDSTLETVVLSTSATKLVTEEVARGVVRGAIEEGAKKRRKNLRTTRVNDSITAEIMAASTQRPRNKRRRKNRTGLRSTNEERELTYAETSVDGDTKRWDKKNQTESNSEGTIRAVSRTINIHGNRMRKGERGSSRIKVGLTETNGRNHGIRGHKRGEPGYNTPFDEDTDNASKINITDTLEGKTTPERIRRSTANIQQRTERRRGIIPKEISPSQESSDVSTEGGASSRLLQESTREQSGLQAIQPQEGTIPSFSINSENAPNQNPSEQIEEPRKMFIEPRIRGDRRKVQIPRKEVIRSRIQHRIRVTTDINDDIRTTGTNVPGGRSQRIESESIDPAAKRWDVSKRRTLTSLEGVEDRSGGEDKYRGRQRETLRETPVTGSSSNRSTNGRVDNRNSPNNQRVVRHREVKETLTSVYAPEE